MSLGLNTNRVTEVLLADGWHRCRFDEDGNSTFDLDAYEYFWNGTMILGGGTVEGVSSTGVIWQEANHPDGDAAPWIAAPLTAVLGIKVNGIY